MAKKRKKAAKRKAKPKVEDKAVAPSKEELKADIESGEREVIDEIKPIAPPPATGEHLVLSEIPTIARPKPTPKPPAKPADIQCANCLKMGPPDEMFYCHHCGKRGCKKCGWYPPKNNVCPNCSTAVRVLRGTR